MRLLRISVSLLLLTGAALGQATGSQTMPTIAAAYQACASTGCTVTLSGDMTVASPQTLTIVAGKPFTLDLNGHTITCTNGSGTICMTITAADVNDWVPFTIRNGIIRYSGNGKNVVGLYVHDQTFGVLFGVHFRDFSGAGSIATVYHNHQFNTIESCTWMHNWGGLKLESTADDTKIHRSRFQYNGEGFDLWIEDSSNFSLLDSLVQSGAARHGVILNRNTMNFSELHFLNDHFENIGDGTASSSAILFNAGTGQIFMVSIANSVFNRGVKQNEGIAAFDYVGGSWQFRAFSRSGNVYNGWSGAPVLERSTHDLPSVVASLELVGPAPGVLHSAIGFDQRENATARLSFDPPTAATKYSMRGGTAADSQGKLLLRDETNGRDVLAYDSSAGLTFYDARRGVVASVDRTGKGTFDGGTTVGHGATLTKYDTCAGPIRPVAVPPNACTEQTFTLPECAGLRANDKIYVNSTLALTARAFPVNWRVSSDGALAATYCNPTDAPVTPTATTIHVVALR